MTAQAIDVRYFGGTMRLHTNMLTPTELSSHFSREGGWWGYLGLDASYILASVTVIGVSGFLTLVSAAAGLRPVPVLFLLC